MIVDNESGVAPNPSVERMAEFAHNQLGEMSDLQNARGLNGVLAGLAHLRGDSSRLPLRRRWLFVAGTAVALGVAALVILPKLAGQKPLTFAMSQGEIQDGGYFRVAAAARPTLQFSDGTKLALVAGARGRVASVDAHGARVMLDEGEARVEVVPHPGARWLFDAGPFVVHVQGTEFELAWKGGEGRLDLRLHKGAVTVTGPLSGEAIALRPGQWLTVHLAAREVFVRDFDSVSPPALSGNSEAPPAPAASAPLLAPPAAADATTTQGKTRRQASPVRSVNSEPAWAPARAEGDWNRILEQATKRGLDRTLAERGSEDLALLADAAHYLNRDDIAQQALLAQRQRFPGSTRAKDAAFLLGRIVEAKSGGASEALGWYERHLQEAPNGVYASEALGRKMTVLARLNGDAAARPVAEEYLQRYPSGTYARAARAYAK